MDDIQSFFEHLAKKRYFLRLQTVSGTCRWDIQGAGNWLLKIERGNVSINADAGDQPADCIILFEREDFVRISQGRQSALTTFLQGRLTITGRLSLAQICLHVLHLEPEDISQC